ncbi:MAG: hypothetical protein J5822_03180 [Eubacteriaceae bacterium]|nr:hypothetical protein [Eubacteriaceae bacterium]
MRHFFLVDYENVKEKGLEGFFSLKRRDTVYVFYSINQQKISMEFIQTLRKGFFNPKIEYVYVKAGKQSLDMQLSSFLGYLISENGTFSCDYTIVSGDRDFLHVLDFWNDRMGKNIVFEYPTIDRYLKKDTVALLSAPKEEDMKESPRRTSSGTRSSSASSSSSRGGSKSTASSARGGSSSSRQSAKKEQDKPSREKSPASSNRTESRSSSESAAAVKEREENVRTSSQRSTEAASAAGAGKRNDRRPAVSGKVPAVKKDIDKEKLLQDTREVITEVIPIASSVAEALPEEMIPEEARVVLKAAADVIAAHSDASPGNGAPAKGSSGPQGGKGGSSEKKSSSSGSQKQEAPSESAASEESPSAAKPQTQSEKTMLNNRLQQVLANAKLDTQLISEITHLVLSHMDEKNFRQVVYREIIKKYRQADGLKYYRIIKNIL